MDHHAAYNRIIENAQEREIDPELRYEHHHIVPRSLGGGDEADNIVALTPREHFICHALLVHMHTGPAKRKMIWALNAMRMNRDRFSARLYERMRHEFVNPMYVEEVKAKHAEAMQKRDNVGMRGQKHSAETRRKMREARAKQIITEETKRKLSEHRKRVSQDPDYVNGCRIGWYVTPWGRFKSLTLAAEGQPCTHMSIKSWCRINNTKKVNAQNVRQSAVFTENDIGKTYAELGFGFEEL